MNISNSTIKFLLVSLCAVVSIGLVGCSRPGPTVSESNSETVQLSTSDSGQGRFSVSETNIDSCFVIVDHSTGVQYLLYGEGQGFGETSWSYTGLCPLLNADGSPLILEDLVEDDL